MRWSGAAYNPSLGVGAAPGDHPGGSEANPTYEQVSAGKTGHAEVVQVEFDGGHLVRKAGRVLLEDTRPTDGRAVAPDFGKQYRPTVLYRTPEQQAVAEKRKAALAAKLGKPVAAEVVALERFYVPEDYHQDYVVKTPKIDTSSEWRSRSSKSSG